MLLPVASPGAESGPGGILLNLADTHDPVFGSLKQHDFSEYGSVNERDDFPCCVNLADTSSSGHVVEFGNVWGNFVVAHILSIAGVPRVGKTPGTFSQIFIWTLAHQS